MKMYATPNKPTKYILLLCNVPSNCLSLSCADISHSRSMWSCTEPQKLFFADLETRTGLFFHAHANLVDLGRAVALSPLQVMAIRTARAGPRDTSNHESGDQRVTKDTAAEGIDFKKVQTMLIRSNEDRLKAVDMKRPSNEKDTMTRHWFAVAGEAQSDDSNETTQSEKHMMGNFLNGDIDNSFRMTNERKKSTRRDLRFEGLHIDLPSKLPKEPKKSLKGGPQDRDHPRKQLRDLAVLSSNNDDAGQVNKSANTVTAGTIDEVLGSKWFEITVPIAEPTNSKARRLVEVGRMKKRGNKWFAEPTVKEPDIATAMKAVDEDGWEAVSAEEADESEYVLV